MRTFIAIELSSPVRDAIFQVQSYFKYSGADVKWVEKENIHLTLKFLGEISDEKLQQVKAILDKIGKSFKPFEINLKDIGAFPEIEFPRIIWVGLDKGAKESTEIAKSIDKELSMAGFEREIRPFSAHITIGRVRSTKNKEALKEKLLSSPGSQLLASDSQLVSSITLFRSALTPKGSIYTKLHEVKLD